jgi:hypothetical protein
MIVDIKKGNFAKGLINYHEKKVERGVGELILDSTFSRTKEQRIAEFLDLGELNRRVMKDRYTHISVSFSDQDVVDRTQQLKIAERYLEGMGYGDAPRLIYEHHDTTHRHFHIVTSTIDLNGKKIAVFKDHVRNQELSRQIEKEFGLKVTEYFRQERQKLQEINASRFGLLKGIEKLSDSPEKRGVLDRVVSPETIDMILNEKLSNEEIKKILTLRESNATAFEQLYRIVRQSNAEYKTEKQQLRDRLSYIKEISKSRAEFIERCEQQNIYVRKIAGEFGSAAFTYGVKERNFYVVERDLPVGLRHDYLFTGKTVDASFDINTQRKYVSRVVQRCLRQSTSLFDFEHLAAKAGIRVEYNANSGGPYGVSFLSANIRDAEMIKGSDIGLSWNKLKTYHGGVEKPSAPALDNFGSKPISFPKGLGKHLDTSNDDEDSKKRKRTSNNEREVD